MVHVRHVAAYFLNIANQDDAEDLISNLKVQKLCYYAQGFHLALYGTRLFDEPIEAWQHGPVVADLYHQFKVHKGSAIPTPDDFDVSLLSDTVQALLNEVYEVYGQFSAWKLRNLTHTEPPWIEASESGTLIADQTMIDYFRTQLL